MPASPTPAQSETSRANGSLSHGPTTPEGKARSAQNGTRHNLHGEFRLLPGEDPARWAALLDGYLARHRPADDAERFWVERLAAAAWRTRRLEAVEADAFEAMLAGATDEPDAGRLPSLATLVRYRARLERDHRHALAELARLREARPRSRDEERPSARAPDPAEQAAAFRRWLDASLAELEAEEADGRGTAEPEAAPAAGPNRQQRRRLAALERRRPAA